MPRQILRREPSQGVRESIAELVQEAAETLPETPGEPPGLDRQERASGSDFSAVQEVRNEYRIPVISVVNLSDLMHHVSRSGAPGDLSSMKLYRERYGLAD